MESKNIFIFSSPLQFLFACIISLNLKNKAVIEGYYYIYDKNFINVYSKILQFLKAPFDNIQILSNLDIDNLKEDDQIFLGNRFNKVEVDLYYKLKKHVKNIFLYEEGFNTYLRHHFNNNELSDYNIKTFIKNRVKLFIGKTPSLIPLNNFNKVYSTFPLDHLRNKSKWNKIEFLKQNHLNSKNNFSDDCIFLSQTIVEDGFINKLEFLKFIELALSELAKKYTVIYFKPHPRNSNELIDKILKLNYKICFLPDHYQDLPAEFFLMENNIDTYGFSSSTLLYASSLFQIKTFQCLEELIRLYPSKKLNYFYSSVEPFFLKNNIEKFEIKNEIK